MKITIILLTTFLALFSVPVFAQNLGTSDMPEIERVETTSTGNILIRKLNAEFDRITEKGYTNDDYDLLSEPAVDIIASAVLPPNGGSLSSTEVEKYGEERVYLVDELEKYAAGLEADSEKAVFFQNAAWFANELVHAD